jgi:Fur family iron response transcriptional regulator
MKTQCLSNSQIEEKLIAAGVNPTAQRLAICRYILCDADHPTAEQVKAWVDVNFPKMSLATVYNTLGILVNAGLLKELTFPHTESKVYDQNVEEHHHFLDEDSGKLFDLPTSSIDVTEHLGRSFKVNRIEVLVRGTKRS